MAYDPKFDDLVEAHLASGHGLASFVHVAGVSRASIYNWRDKHPSFAQAIERGNSKRIMGVEGCLNENMRTGEGNATTIMFTLMNLARDDYQDMRKIQHTGANGGPVEIKTEFSTAKEAQEAYTKIMADADNK